MSTDSYNQSQLDDGNITIGNITTLVRFWQEKHALKVDGECGPRTLATLEDLIEPSRLGMNALSMAVGFMGDGEEGGNNSGSFVESLHLKDWDGDDDDDGAWCAAFVSTCFEMACKESSTEMPFKRSVGAKILYQNIGKAGFFTQLPNVAPGDVVCWDRGDVGSWQGHIGIVERYDAESGLLHTIEGNVGRYPAKVRRFTHDMSKDRRLEGFARMSPPIFEL